MKRSKAAMVKGSDNRIAIMTVQLSPLTCPHYDQSPKSRCLTQRVKMLKEILKDVFLSSSCSETLSGARGVGEHLSSMSEALGSILVQKENPTNQPTNQKPHKS
jgi:hypothetical protein